MFSGNIDGWDIRQSSQRADAIDICVIDIDLASRHGARLAVSPVPITLSDSAKFGLRAGQGTLVPIIWNMKRKVRRAARIHSEKSNANYWRQNLNTVSIGMLNIA